MIFFAYYLTIYSISDLGKLIFQLIGMYKIILHVSLFYSIFEQTTIFGQSFYVHLNEHFIILQSVYVTTSICIKIR